MVKADVLDGRLRGHDGVLADACGEVPLPEIVRYNTERHARVGYLERFASYFRQLGFTAEEHRQLAALDAAGRAALMDRVGERQGWLAQPDVHLQAAGCQLTLVVGEDLPAGFGVEPVEPERILERYAALKADVRLFIGIDPASPSSLSRALSLASHPRAAGLAVSPWLAGAPVDDAAFDATLRAALEQDLPLWVHACAHYRPDVAYDIEHPRQIDAAMRRYPQLRLMIGHAGWPWTADACVVALRYPNVVLEFATFPPALLRDPGWSLTPLYAQREALRGRVCFGSGATSSPQRFARLVQQLDEVELGDHLPDWRGGALLQWLR
ncbi:MAG TPA: amidohydrolase family protein [Ramlibacter sp.]|nr:amidohydrolase family protein [Ramlibacter sp.]